MIKEKTPWIIVIVLALVAIGLDAYAHPVLGWIVALLAIGCIRTKDLFLGLAVFVMTLLFWLKYESNWIFIWAVVWGIIIMLPKDQKTAPSGQPVATHQSMPSKGLSALGKAGVAAGLTAGLAYGAYKLAYKMTAYKGRKRKWHTRKNDGNDD
jgi:hypothetical protein